MGRCTYVKREVLYGYNISKFRHFFRRCRLPHTGAYQMACFPRHTVSPSWIFVETYETIHRSGTSV